MVGLEALRAIVGALPAGLPAAVLVTSEAAASRLGLEPRARFVSFGLAGVAVPVLLQPNFSAALLLILLSALVLFAGGARIGHFILLGMVGLPLLWKHVDGVAYALRRIVFAKNRPPRTSPTATTWSRRCRAH